MHRHVRKLVEIYNVSLDKGDIGFEEWKWS